MRYSFLFFVLFACTGTVLAQPLAHQAQPAFKPNTYAVVIGISAYADPDITPLEFSNRDAIVFADFLMSASGGSVPRQNIKLLVDSAATSGEVDKAIRWLKDNSKQDDKVFFYFSGHGALENVTMYKNGYLICFNTPAAAFVNMALSIDYLNDVANTLAVEIKANVIMITDACHSGKMAGSKFKGNYLVGEQLLAAKEKEIRMASCTPDQLSNEKKDWGGGRGVFSYHLVNGLQGGLADKDQDKIVSLGELKIYMESAMANDPVLKSGGEVQTPVIKAEKLDFWLATVVESETIKIKEQLRIDSTAQVIVMSAMAEPGRDELIEPTDYFFRLLKKQQLESLTDSAGLHVLPTGDIAFALIGELGNRQISEKERNKLAELVIVLKNDKEKLDRFNLDLASAFLDVGQNVIANYIGGDEAELERRRYYNSRNNGYDVYTRMFEVAFKLSQHDKYYKTKAEVFLHYFSGLALRLKIPLTEDPQALIAKALDEQKKALALEEYAAYIYNELGVLYQLKKNYTEAENFYIKATQLSPKWAIPQSNLGSLYIGRKNYEKAMDHADIADSLQSNLQSISINRGIIHEKKGNLLFAEEDYHRAIERNSRHFLPFERLGYVNMNTSNYAMADSFFYEADLRKQGYHFKGNDWESGPIIEALSPFQRLVCKVDSSILEPTDVAAFFTWGVQEYYEKKYANAVRLLRKVVAIEKTNPLVYHYLGKIYFDQQKWEEAELMFKLALKYSKNQEQFNLYADSLFSSKKYKYYHECFETFFKGSLYRQVNDYYFLGTLYENWKHVEEAEKYFKMITRFDVITYGEYGQEIYEQNRIEISDYEKIAAYVKLWQFLEKQGRYHETEEIIKIYGTITIRGNNADRELNEFYRRMIDRYPYNGDWPYKLGNLLYKYAPLTARLPYLDSIAWFPLLNREMFIDSTVYLQFYANDSLVLYDKSETGSVAKVKIDPEKINVKRTSYLVPGTNENILSADAIYMPRMDGIAYLKKAAALISEKETLADIHFKTGNIYLWAGSKKQAYPYFEKSLSWLPDNANARLTLIDIYKALYKNRAAFNQLNYLYDSSQINFDKRMLLARFNIHAGNFELAKILLDGAEWIHPYVVPDIADLRGRMYLLSDKPQKAIPYYQQHFMLNNRDVGSAYSLARLYAKTGNDNEAFKWLDIAVKGGFNYSYVLKYDPYMDGLRKIERWKTLVGSISKKIYPANFAFN